MNTADTIPAARLESVSYTITRATTSDLKGTLERIPALRGKVTPRLIDALRDGEPKLLEHLRRDPLARQRFLTDPVPVLAAVPGFDRQAVTTLRSAAGTVHQVPDGVVPPHDVSIAIDVSPAPRPPIIQRPELPPLAPLGTLGGFDACLAIGEGALGFVVKLLLEDQLKPALDVVPMKGMPAPVAAAVALPLVDVSPACVIDVAAQRVRALLTTSGEVNAVVDLRQLLGMPGLPAAVTALPVTFGPLVLSGGIDLTITLDEEALTVAQAALELSPAQLPSASGIAAQLTAAAQQQLPTGKLLEKVLAGVDALAESLAAALPGAVVAAAQGGVIEVFPLTTSLSLDPAGESPCGIGTRDPLARLLPAQLGGEPSLAMLTTQLPDSQGTTDRLASPLAPGDAAGVFMDNFFLLSSVACELQHSDVELLAGLPAPDRIPQRTDPNPSVRWTDLHERHEVTDEDGNTHEVELNEVTLEIDTTDPDAKAFLIGIRFVVFGLGWRAHVDLTIPITFELFTDDTGAGLVGPEMKEATKRVAIELEWWVVVAAVLILPIALFVGALVIGAIVAAITVGAIAGAGLTALPTILALVVIGVIARKVGRTVDSHVAGAGESFAENTVEVLPPELNTVLGFVAPGRVRFDDLEIAGELSLPRRRTVIQPSAQSDGNLVGHEAAAPRQHPPITTPLDEAR